MVTRVSRFTLVGLLSRASSGSCRRTVAARRRGRAGRAVSRDAAPGEGGHRPGPGPRRHYRDHPGRKTAGDRRPRGTRWSPPTPRTPAGRPSSTSPAAGTTGTGNRITSCCRVRRHQLRRTAGRPRRPLERLRRSRGPVPGETTGRSVNRGRPNRGRPSYAW